MPPLPAFLAALLSGTFAVGCGVLTWQVVRLVVGRGQGE